MTDACQTVGCTVGETGVCLLNNDPEVCEFRVTHDTTTLESDDSLETELTVSPVLETWEDKPVLWDNLPLEVGELSDYLGSRKCLLVGVVGTPAAGKTAALVSMYLRLGHGSLEGFQFAKSTRLLAFEEISQGARVWSTPPPDAMTARTTAGGRRVAGFLHLRLKKLDNNTLLDLLIPDMPGEWSDTLIDSNRTEGLGFLASAQVIWVFVNGAELRDNATRMHTMSRTKQLLRRVAAMLEQGCPPVKIVVTHSDSGPLLQATSGRLNQIADELNLSAEIIEIASFSANEQVQAGAGISDLILKSIPTPQPAGIEWPDDTGGLAGRFMNRYVGEKK
ncbi:hypothetical protein EUU23_09335 [Sphingorhabdus sp. IMCC26285]|uniref:Double-GTPase 2 domain-containing protein n=1 Tax=Sphingorhabdus profundilacus TaxID=2509718 RepID=A0A6I4M5L8_9SPHN|nr:hypothetical protein [Sphingorhabdus profundilacus]MVZ97908.1 hypothetical protein [Sphingorhabdus profundilacus]